MASRNITLRLREEELRLIEKAAVLSCLDRTAYMRMCILRDARKRIPILEAMLEKEDKNGR